MRKKISFTLIAAMMMLTMAACGTKDSGNKSSNNIENVANSEEKSETENVTEAEDVSETSSANVTSTGMIDATDLFTDRDLTQTVDYTEAQYYTVTDGQNITIKDEGVYVISGSAENMTIFVEAEEEAKVQLVLDSVDITNETMPCIYVKSGDKVFVTTTETDNSLTVSGTFTADGETNLDAVIFSKEDLVLNGLGTLKVDSTDNGITSKDTLTVTGGTLEISCSGSALEGQDAIEIADGIINILSCNDGLHAEDNEDDSKGYIYICGGAFNIDAIDDAIHATTIIQLDGGEYNLTAAECLEGTYIQINDGTVNINASDDGINAANKSSQYTPTYEQSGGEVTIVMGAGDTDGVDSNGNIYINGGMIDISGQSTFDYDGVAEYNGGSIIENGTETNTITNQFMGGGPGGGHGGPAGDDGGFGGPSGDGGGPFGGGPN